jgi:hypothetical protein
MGWGSMKVQLLLQKPRVFVLQTHRWVLLCCLCCAHAVLYAVSSF